MPLVRAVADVQLVGALDARLARRQQRHALSRRLQQRVREPAQLFRKALRAEIERVAGELLLAGLGAVLPARDAVGEREALRDRRLDVVDAVHLDRDRHAGGIEPHARGELRTAAAIVVLVAEVARAVGGNRARLHARGLLHDQDRITCLTRVLRERAARRATPTMRAAETQHRQTPFWRKFRYVRGVQFRRFSRGCHSIVYRRAPTAQLDRFC